jgi:hypothetical protein
LRHQQFWLETAKDRLCLRHSTLIEGWRRQRAPWNLVRPGIEEWAGYLPAPKRSQPERGPLVPRVRHKRHLPVAPVSVNFPGRGGPHTGKHHFRHVMGIRFGVSQRQGRAPGPAKDQPALNAEVAPQPFDICKQMGSGVGGEVRVRVTGARRAPAGPALVKQNDPIDLGIEVAPQARRTTRTRAAMKPDSQRRVLCPDRPGISGSPKWARGHCGRRPWSNLKVLPGNQNPYRRPRWLAK